MSRLLISENPLMVSPSLAVKAGLNEALVLQQIHYWIHSSRHVIDGRKWIYNTYKDWQLQFPFWSESTIKRTIHSLEAQGLVKSGNFNHSKMDKTKWYTIDYQTLAELEDPSDELSVSQEEPPIFTESDEEETSLTDTPPPSEKKTEPTIPATEIIEYLNAKTNSTYKPGTHSTQQKIKARFREGFTLEDFKKVIDLKTAEWLNHPEMGKYLRPETLFGNKFESYLNQKSSFKHYREEDFDLND